LFDAKDTADTRDPGTLRITPDANRFAVAELEDAFVRLHGLGPDLELDVRLTADGTDLVYTVSTNTHVETVQHLLRNVCSAGITIESITTPPESPVLDDGSPDAALQFRGCPDRRKDWQMRLRPTVEVDDVGVR
jgi:hypothetical protein